MNQPTPRPVPQKKKPNWVIWSLIGGAGLCFLLIVNKCSKNQKDIDTDDNATTVAKNTPLPTHELLKQDGTNGSKFINLWFYVKANGRDTTQVKQIATALIQHYCATETCNQVYFWKNKEAFNLSEYKRANLGLDKFDFNKDRWLKAEAKWNKKHWTFVCENVIAAYDNNSGELDYLPYMDSEYRKYGGKMKRPPQYSTNLNLGVPRLSF